MSNDQPLSPLDELKLVPAHLDFRNVRVQMAVGMFLVFWICTLVDFKMEQAHVPLHLCLHFGCCALAGLIALEISGLYGNKYGAVPAIWTALLLATHPIWSYSVPSASHVRTMQDTQYITGVLLLLLSFFLYQRFKSMEELPYLVLSLLSYGASFLYQGVAGAFPVAIMGYELIFCRNRYEVERSTRYKWVFYFLLFLSVALIGAAITQIGKIGFVNRGIVPTSERNIVFMSLMSLLGPSGAAGSLVAFERGTADLTTLLSELLFITLIIFRLIAGRQLLGLLCFSVLWTFALPLIAILLGANANYTSDFFAVFAAAGACLVYAFVAFPATDSLPKKTAAGFSVAGLLFLVALSSSWFFQIR